MKEPKIFLENSFCRLEGFSKEHVGLIKELLTYQNDIEAEKNQLFYQMKVAKANKNNRQLGYLKKMLKDLQATEWVCWLREDTFPTGHYRLVRELLQELKVKYKEIDNRLLPDNKTYKLGFIKKNHKPRYYQEEMLKIAETEHRGVFESAVGTGKSMIMQYLIVQKNTPTLIVVPSKPLKEQHITELLYYFGKNKVGLYEAKEVRKAKKLKPIRLITVQSLAALQKSGDVDKILEGIGMVLIDEFHHAGSKSYTDLMEKMNHIYYRYGFTGTFLRNDGKTLDMWGFLSNCLYSYKAKKATEDGFLTPAEVRVHNLTGFSARRYQREYNLNYCGNRGLLKEIQNIIEEADDGAQVLILVNRKDKAGAVIHDYLDRQGIENTYISGDDTADFIKKSLKDFNAKKIKVLIGSQVIGEGIDIRSTDHIVMAQGGKSEIAITQAIGRAVRLYEGKKKAYIHDFRFEDTKYMEKHLEIRLEIYQRNFGAEVVEQ